MKAIINEHVFEKIGDKFNFGDGLFIDLPTCYVIDDETVPEAYFYRALAEAEVQALAVAEAD